MVTQRSLIVFCLDQLGWSHTHWVTTTWMFVDSKPQMPPFSFQTNRAMTATHDMCHNDVAAEQWQWEVSLTRLTTVIIGIVGGALGTLTVCLGLSLIRPEWTGNTWCMSDTVPADVPAAVFNCSPAYRRKTAFCLRRTVCFTHTGQNSIESHCNDIKSYINIANTNDSTQY